MALGTNPNVTTIAKSGSTGLSGNVTLSQGTNVTLTQSGNDISIAATGSGSMSIGGSVTSGTAGSVLFVGAGPVLAQDNTNFFFTDADDSLGLGPSAATNSFTISGSSIKGRLLVQANKAGTDLSDLVLWNGSTTAGQGPRIDFTRNKNTIASPTVVASGDEIGMLSFNGYDGTDYEMAAVIVSEVDGTPGSNDMPGRLVFKATPDGSATPLEMLRLSGGTLDRIQLFNGQPSVTATEDVVLYNPTVTMNPSAGTVNHSVFTISPTVTANPGAAAVLQEYGILMSPTVTFSGGLAHIYYGLFHSGTFTYTVSPGFANTYSLFVGNPTLTSSTATVGMPNINGIFQASPVYAAGNAAVGTTLQVLRSFYSTPSFTCTGGSSTMTGTSVGYYDAPTFSANTAGSALTITKRTGFSFENFGNTVTGTVTITNNIGLDLVDQSATSGNLTVTNLYGIRSALTSGTNRFFIYHSGSADSVHTGEMNFGSTTVPTALVDIDGSTTARSSLRIKSGTAPTTPNSGDVWHDSTRQCLMTYCGGMRLGITKINFAATAAGTVGGTAAETTVAGTGIGTLTLAANFLTVGKTIKIRAWGVYGTKAPAVGTFTLRFKYGSTTLISLAPTLTGSLTNQMWEAEFELTCRTTGATGTVFPQGKASFYTSTTAVGFIVAGPTATTTIDTTASSKIDITAQWGTSNASNTITCHNFTSEVLY